LEVLVLDTPGPTRSDTLVTTRAGVGALVGVAVLFAAYPLLRPWTDESVLGAFTSPWWVVSHLCAVGAFVLLPVAALAMGARAAAVTLWAGAALVLPYYGVESLGLRGIGLAALARGDGSLLAIAETVRLDGWAATVFVLGLALLAVGGVLLAVAVARLPRTPAWAGWPLAVGLVLLLPQFFAPPEVRIAHGLLVAAGAAVLAVTLRGEELPRAS
jgi:hypothetical protein